MSVPTETLRVLRTRLEASLADGLAQDALDHATQVAEIAAVLHAAFAEAGFTTTLVGGSAIEIHAPGIYRSGDLDLVIEGDPRRPGERDQIFWALGFSREGRHWRHAQDLFVEVVRAPVEGPSEDVRVGNAEFRIVTQEVVLRDRIVGSKQWKYTGYGQQAVDMLAAFGDELDMAWLAPELEREGSLDALEALRSLADSSTGVSDESLRQLLERLHQR